jgi:initiation factor 1A
MVKNTAGGKYAKKSKRGSLNPPLQTKTRVVSEEGELYACVKRILGNGRIEVMCIDNVLRQCHIPKKFRYFKRDNIIRVNSWVMVGIRLWESGKNNCDLLEVYSPYDIDYLKKLNENWFVFGEDECSDLFGTDEIEISEERADGVMQSSNDEVIDLNDI